MPELPELTTHTHTDQVDGNADDEPDIDPEDDGGGEGDGPDGQVHLGVAPERGQVGELFEHALQRVHDDGRQDGLRHREVGRGKKIKT